MAENEVDFSELTSQINKLTTALRRAAGESASSIRASEQSTRAEEELTKQKKKVAEDTSKYSQHLRRSTTTTETMARAQLAFTNELGATNKALKNAGKSVEEQKISNQRIKTSLGLYSNTISGAIAIGKGNIELAKRQYSLSQAGVAQAAEVLRLQQNKNSGLRQEYDYLKDRLTRATQERNANAELLGINLETISYNKSQIQVAAKEQQAIEEKISAIKTANVALKAEADASRDLERYMQSQIKIANEEVQASKDKIDGYHKAETAQKSEIDAINEQIRQLEKRGEFKGRGKQTGPSKEDRALVETLKAKEKSILASFEDTKKMRAAEQEYAQSVLASIPGMEDEKQKAADVAGIYESAMSKNNEALSKENFKRLDVIQSLGNMQKENDTLSGQTAALKKEIETQTSALQPLTKMVADKAQAVKAGKEAEEDYINALKDSTAEMEAAAAAELNAKVETITNVMKKVSDNFSAVGKALMDMVGAVRKTQQQFGITAGQAANLKLDNLVTSFQSYVTSVTSLGKKAAVSAAEIEQTQADFQSEFGGVLTSEAAGEIARQAKEMGVGAGELAKARRVFMTQTMGDTGAAKSAQDKFIGEFQKKGLTSKDAMAAIAQNSELLARNGTRFATSFARAAADAKKIGVDLSKVDQVGDNIIGDFEGFLEKQAELGAMGFGFDSSRLAEVAETGDTGALFDELRSQLAATGKDITKLRRSEQLALSSAFGMSMEELQRMAGPDAGSGEETLSPEELQKDSNASLGSLVNLAEVAGVTLGVIAVSVGLIAKAMATRAGGNIATRILSRGAGTASTAARTASSASTVARTASTASTVARTATVAAPAAAGAAGAARGASVLGRVAGGASTAARGLGSVAKVGGRLLGKAALPLSLAMGAYDAYQGFTADKEASTGQKFKNAGSSVLSGLTFGLLGKDASEIAASSGQAGRGATATSATSVVRSSPTLAPIAAVPAAVTAAGATTTQPLTATPTTTVNVDMSKLEAKLDALVRAIGSMEVKMDGNKVGQVMVSNDQKASVAGVFRAQRV